MTRDGSPLYYIVMWPVSHNVMRPVSHKVMWLVSHNLLLLYFQTLASINNFYTKLVASALVTSQMIKCGQNGILCHVLKFLQNHISCNL